MKTFPIFQKSVAHNVRWESETKSVWVNYIGEVSLYDSLIFGTQDYLVESTEAEFKKAFKNALDNFVVMYHDFFDKENEFVKNETLKSEGY